MVHPLEPAVVSFGSVEGGTKGNIIPDRVRLLGTLRALDDALVARMEDRLVRIAEGSAAPLGVRASVSFHAPYPATVNHPGPSARVAAAIADAATPWTGPSPFPCMGAEDFALYLQRVPGAYFFLGSGGPDGAAPGVHRADYDFDDAAIPFGIRVFLRLVEAAAGRGLVAPASPREVS
jgi:hippurate hydrolase